MSLALAASILATLLGSAALLELARLPPRPARPTRAAVPAPRWAAPEIRPGDAKLERLLDAAGRASVPDAAALANRCRGSAVLGGAWAAAPVLLLGGALPALAAAAVGGALGQRLPHLLLRQSAQRRATRLRDESPELLDLIAVAAACGLPLPAICAAASRWTEGELTDGLTRCGAELAAGAGIEPALERLAREHPVGEIEALTAILLRARRHGTPAAPALRALASGARDARARRAMEHAARAAPRVQLVAALLLVPAALCILGAALVSRAG